VCSIPGEEWVEFLEVFFPVSGVKTYIFVPPLIACAISFFTSMGGVSGAFLLLPFQMSILNFSSPSVSSTNFLFNVVAIPSGVYRYIKEGRMAWPLTIVIIAGTLPGVFLGYYVRVLFLPDPETFKFFAGIVLLYIGVRLLYDLRGKARPDTSSMKAIDVKFQQSRTRHGESSGKQTPDRGQGTAAKVKITPGLPADAVVRTVSFSLRKTEYEFWGNTFSFSTIAMFSLAFIVGVIGGTYGIGGGAIIAPFCVALFRLPVYTVAGAALMGTFLTSVAGVLFYTLMPAKGGLQTSPDWLLGCLFGAGGFVGMYFGARFQKYVPQKLIKLLLGFLMVLVALKYILQYAE